MNLSPNAKGSLFASCSAHKMSPGHFLCFRSTASSKAAFRTQRAKFLPFRLRQSPYNRRSQVDPYSYNTDQLAKPASVDSTELSRQPKRQKLCLLSTWSTYSSMSCEAALKSAKKNTEIGSKFGFGQSQRLRFASQAQTGAEAGHVQEHGRCMQLRRCGCWHSPKSNFEPISVYIKNQNFSIRG